MNNPLAAQSEAASLLTSIGQLKTFPYLDVEVKQAPDPAIVRDLLVGQYTVRYLTRPEKIDIFRVWHHKEDR